MHEAWKYSFETTSIHELKRYAIASFYPACLPISSHFQPIECKSISIGPQWMQWQRRTKS